MRCAVGQEWDGNICTGNAKLFSFDEGSSLKTAFAGYSDWLIPTVDELKMLIDRTRTGDLINLDTFPKTNAEFFWALSSDPAKPDYVWKVNFKSGKLSCSPQMHALQKGYIRLVRYERNKERSIPERNKNHQSNDLIFEIEKKLESASQSIYKNISSSINRFIDNLDGTVTDKSTGLIWMCNALDQMYKADQAFSLQSTLAGHTDWRLPSIEELKYFFTLDESNPFINVVAFSNAVVSHFWSCTKTAEYPFATLMMNFKNGVVCVGDDKTRCLVRLVCDDLKSLNSIESQDKIFVASNTLEKDDSFSNFFTDNKNGTFTDSRSKLIWRRYAVGQVWDDAVVNGKADIFKSNQIDSLRKELDSLNFWRIPTIDELITLVGATKNDHLTAYIENPSRYFFSSSKNSEPPFWPWFIDLRNGKIYESNDRTRGQVRLVCDRTDVNEMAAPNSSIYKDQTEELLSFEKVCPENDVDKIIFDRIESFENKLNSFATRFDTVIEAFSDGRTEKYKSIQSSIKIENHLQTINDLTARILARIDSLDDQLKMFGQRFDTAITSIATTQVETLNAASQILQVSDAKVKKVFLEIDDLRKVIVESLHISSRTTLIAPTTAETSQAKNKNNGIMTFLDWLVQQEIMTFSELRNRLLPLDLLPSAVIDEINERALNLTGESALEEDGKTVIVQNDVLLKVIETWEGQGNQHS